MKFDLGMFADLLSNITAYLPTTASWQTGKDVTSRKPDFP